MKITMCGSMHHIDAMLRDKNILETQGYEVETPSLNEAIDYNKLPAEERVKQKVFLIKEHRDKINDSDAILIFNKEKNGIPGYIGGNTLMEMAFAHAQNIMIFLLNPVPDMSYRDEILGMEPIVLHGDVDEINQYIDALPITVVSSKSPIKLLAVSRGMQRAGIRTKVISKPVQSNIAEQPKTMDETYEGAMNRHNNLKETLLATSYTYLATVESGLHPIHPAHDLFHTNVVILEKKEDQKKIGLELQFEIPKVMTDKIPSVYPDLGALVKEEYDSPHKDAIPFVTNGKVTRKQVVENVVFGLAAQFSPETS